MSSTLLGEVWGLPVSTTEKLLLAYLSDSADHYGNLPERTTKGLAEVIARSAKTTRTTLKSLTDAGYLVRSSNVWLVVPYPGGRLTVDKLQHAVDVLNDPTPPPVATVVPIKSEPTPRALSPEKQDAETRLAAFCQAWGLTSPSDNLLHAWEMLELAEKKHNKKTQHKDPETQKAWTVTEESIDGLLPEILHAVQVFHMRAEEGLPNHADGPAAFIDRELWLAPEYQVSLAEATTPPKTIEESAIDAMVMELNKAGGPNQCHLRVTSKNPHTGEFETETLEVYANRVQAKYDQFKATAEYFTE